MYGYIAIVIPRPGSGYRLEFPNLPGCRAAAPSVEDALGKAESALRSYTAELSRQGLDLPQPRPSWAMVSETERYDAVAAACVAPPRLPIDPGADVDVDDTVDATDELFETVLRVFSVKR